MKISVIIPTYNEASGIVAILRYLKEELRSYDHELIVADASSPDGTAALAKGEGAMVVVPERKSRAVQMNAGAARATGDILYFLHADTFPPKGFPGIIIDAITKNTDCGCFRLSFDIDHWFLKLNCWFTRFNVKYFRWGDQSLFIKSEVFRQSEGFRNDLRVMEDQEYVIRLQKHYLFKVLPFSVRTSARKYQDNGVIKLQLIFTALQIMYHQGASQERILRIYGKLIRDKKVNS